MVEKVSTNRRGVENGLITAGHTDMDTTQVHSALERKVKIRMLQRWPTRKMVPQHITKIPDWPGWMIR